MKWEEKEVTEIAFTSFLNLSRFQAGNGLVVLRYLGFCFPKIRVLKCLQKYSHFTHNI